MVEIVITTLKDVGQPKTNSAIPIDEIDGKLKRGACNISANIDFIGWGPSFLRYNSALSCADAEIQWQHQVLRGYAWRRRREVRRILHNIPYTLRI